MTQTHPDPSPDSTAADIAWMRNLAEENARAPMEGASILMAAGLIFGTASLVHWAAVSPRLPLPDGLSGWSWLTAALAFGVTLFVLIRGLARREGVETAGNRASGTAWSALGWGIFALFVSTGVLSWRLADAEVGRALLSLSPSVIMVFYGVGWAVSGAMHRDRLMWTLAFASFAAAPLLALLGGQDSQFLAYAAALFALMALPGWLFMRAANRA